MKCDVPRSNWMHWEKNGQKCCSSQRHSCAFPFPHLVGWRERGKLLFPAWMTHKRRERTPDSKFTHLWTLAAGPIAKVLPCLAELAVGFDRVQCIAGHVGYLAPQIGDRRKGVTSGKQNAGRLSPTFKPPLFTFPWPRETGPPYASAGSRGLKGVWVRRWCG